MGNVSYAVNERVRRLLKWALIGIFLLALISPFLIFSTWGATKLHDWAAENKNADALYWAARLHCLMGTLTTERYAAGEQYMTEFLQKYGSHKKAGYAAFYIAWAREEQKHYGSAKRQYEYFLAAYPENEKVPAAQKALNRIEAYGIRTEGE